MQGAAGTLKKISLELGGKSPSIFFADADFESAVAGALFGVFLNQGEVCSAGSRILVERSIYQPIPRRDGREGARRSASATGSTGRRRWDRSSPRPIAPACAAIRRSARARRSWRSAAACRPGSRSRADFSSSRRSSTTSTTRARIAQEEIFGPVACVIPFDDEDDALRIANDTHYGLAAAVWSRDIFRVMRVVRALRAGVVWVNQTQVSAIEAPWGGYKQSGFGRELGRWGVEEYLQVKQVYINVDDQPFKWY